MPGLTCGMWDHTQVHLHWEHGILATGPPGKSPLQYSRLENPTDRGDWWATIHGVAKSRTQPSDWTELNWTVDLGWTCSSAWEFNWLPIDMERPQRGRLGWLHPAPWASHSLPQTRSRMCPSHEDDIGQERRENYKYVLKPWPWSCLLITQ